MVKYTSIRNVRICGLATGPETASVPRDELVSMREREFSKDSFHFLFKVSVRYYFTLAVRFSPGDYNPIWRKDEDSQVHRT